jgi:hypothetical protein
MTKFKSGDKVKVLSVPWPIEGKIEVGEAGTVVRMYCFDTDKTPTLWTYIVDGDRGWQYGLDDNEMELVE